VPPTPLPAFPQSSLPESGAHRWGSLTALYLCLGVCVGVADHDAAQLLTAQADGERAYTEFERRRREKHYCVPAGGSTLVFPPPDGHMSASVCPPRVEHRLSLVVLTNPTRRAAVFCLSCCEMRSMAQLVADAHPLFVCLQCGTEADMSPSGECARQTRVELARRRQRLAQVRIELGSGGHAPLTCACSATSGSRASGGHGGCNSAHPPLTPVEESPQG
jgi:hypothetical protein